MGDTAYFHSIGPLLSGATPMSGMQVLKYATGGNTSKAAWSDSAKSATVSNPMTANAYGFVNFYGDGAYRLVILDPNSTTIDDRDPVQIGPVQPVEFAVHKNGTDQSALSASVYTKLTWSTEDYDAAGTFGSNKWTPGRTGRALLVGCVRFNSVVSGSRYHVAFYKNSAQHQINFMNWEAYSGFGQINLQVIMDITSTTDFIELYAKPDTVTDIDGAIDATWFHGALIA